MGGGKSKRHYVKMSKFHLLRKTQHEIFGDEKLNLISTSSTIKPQTAAEQLHRPDWTPTSQWWCVIDDSFKCLSCRCLIKDAFWYLRQEIVNGEKYHVTEIINPLKLMKITLGMTSFFMTGHNWF